MFHVSSRLLSEDSILEAILMSQPIIFGETHNLVGFRFYKEHEFCKSKQDLIISSATKIYENTLKKGFALSKFHCDYVCY